MLRLDWRTIREVRKCVQHRALLGEEQGKNQTEK